ncbi:hypothetical protein [[Clostridium] innocuum]|nr:hypothetical protein [[Clostridium] innocuum]QQR28457.1 hypothetical protein I5Q87_14865 [[Clostridium] innocuum]
MLAIYRLSKTRITANGWWFREWAMAVCKALQLPFYTKSFGLETEE